ncbi:hypothetical protein [Rhodoligotrophos ferricapiens]|uniref:hypothetical protein n=1 Tax=Rhodoligotrophos ferricapiens TaxID=3069264 RepID=UPI00315D0A16
MRLELTYGDPCLARVWSLRDGFPVCEVDAIPCSDPTVRHVVAKSAAISEAVEVVEAYEAAQRVREPGSEIPQEIPELDPETGEPTGEMVPNPDWQEIPKTVPVYDPDTGEPVGQEPHPAWAAYEAAQSILGAADDLTVALALIRAGEPVKIDPETGDVTEQWQAWRAAAGAVGAGIADRAAQIEPVVDVPLPTTIITNRQAKLALVHAGLLDQVNQLMENRPAAERIEWEYTSTVRRDHPLILQLAPALGLTEAEIDDLFRLAATLD